MTATLILAIIALGATIVVVTVSMISITAHTDWLSRQRIARRLEQARGH